MNAFTLLCLFDRFWYALRWKCCSTRTTTMSSGNSSRLHSASLKSIANMTTSVITKVNTSAITLIRPELNVSDSVFT